MERASHGGNLSGTETTDTIQKVCTTMKLSTLLVTADLTAEALMTVVFLTVPASVTALLLGPSLPAEIPILVRGLTRCRLAALARPNAAARLCTERSREMTS